MKKKSVLWLASLALMLGTAIPATAIDRQSLAAYAASLRGKKKAELKAALEPLLKPQKVLSYGGRGEGYTWYGFYDTDRDPATDECYNRYSSKKFYFSGHDGTAISGMNIEHSFPKSWWGGDKNMAYKDLYNLYPSDASANSVKSNYPMAKVTNVDASKSEEGYDKIGTGYVDGVSRNCWEPGDAFKGDFARSYMYMAVSYASLTFVNTGLQTMSNEDYPGLKAWASELYIAWGNGDRVSEVERARNNAVANIQGSRNLFVDYPYLAEYVWGDSVDVAFDPSTSLSTASDDGRYMGVTDEPDTPSADLIHFVKAETVAAAGGQYLVVASSGGKLYAMSPLGETQTYGYPQSVGVTAVDDTISLATEEQVFTLQETAGGYFIVDGLGRYLYHEGTYKTLSVTASEQLAAVWTLTPNADGTFGIDAGDGYSIRYSSQYGTFGCYNTSENVVPMLYVRAEKGATTAIFDVKPLMRPASQPVYTLQGQYVGQSTGQLPSGIYVRGGKKFVVK